jgi:ABC-type nitrate/sulfonate/bicarbonate transport system substrate-binding protein
LLEEDPVARRVQAGALANRSIDVGLQTEPMATASAERGAAIRWRTADELTPGMVTSVWTYSPIFVEQKPEAARRWMVGLLRGVRGYVGDGPTAAGLIDNQFVDYAIGRLGRYQ